MASASAIPCQPGSISSQIPTGRSNRPIFSHGRSAPGAKRSTQLEGPASGRGASGRGVAAVIVVRACLGPELPIGTGGKHMRLTRRALAQGALAGGTMLAAGRTALAAQVKGKPKFGAFGLDLTAMDHTVAPGNDFQRYASGAWMKTA